MPDFSLLHWDIPLWVHNLTAACNLLFLIFVLFFERKESRRRFVWILILVFMPTGVGMVLYILFSGHIFAATRRIRDLNEIADRFSAPMRDRQKTLLLQRKSSLPNHVIKAFVPLVGMNLMEGNSLLTYAESPELFTYGAAFFDDLCQELEKAQHSINMEFFIYRQDQIGNKVMEILCRKAREGVDVKLLYDDFGCFLTRVRFFRRLDVAGGKSHPFFLVRVGLPLTLNYRNHRKAVIIDSRKAYIGGMNIGDEYANWNPRRRLNWRDTMVKLEGSCVLAIQSNFLGDWYSQEAWVNRPKTIESMLSYFPPSLAGKILDNPERGGENSLVDVFSEGRIATQVITNDPCGSKKANIEDAFIRMIMGAKKNVYIETPYFTPDEEFQNALKIASYSGVKISIVIPGDWDKFFMKAASSDFAREMCAFGIRFYIYPGFIHSKMISVDGKISSIGTTNIDTRSFSLHFEENVLFYDERFTSRCDAIIERDMQHSQAVNKEYFDRQPIFVRAFWSFCRLFSPLM
ncbi:MAG: PLDc N-terminal domain-containing protein [Treponema sp.]|nr:PLDc N-terminal domain-containing protein [Treponema sp.]